MWRDQHTSRLPIVLLISGEAGAEFGYDDERLEDGTLLSGGSMQTPISSRSSVPAELEAVDGRAHE